MGPENAFFRAVLRRQRDLSANIYGMKQTIGK